MKLTGILSTAVAALCVALSIWLFVVNTANQTLQGELQNKQQQVQTQQQQAQAQQQLFQEQEQKISAGSQLAQQVGPAVLRDLGSFAVQKKNERIKKLLAKYGVTVKENEAAAPETGTTPAAPAPSTSPAPVSPSPVTPAPKPAKP
jgi:predicted Holliday junction resolvase-like endonuclease